MLPSVQNTWLQSHKCRCSQSLFKFRGQNSCHFVRCIVRIKRAGTGGTRVPTQRRGKREKTSCNARLLAGLPQDFSILIAFKISCENSLGFQGTRRGDCDNVFRLVIPLCYDVYLLGKDENMKSECPERDVMRNMTCCAGKFFVYTTNAVPPPSPKNKMQIAIMTRLKLQYIYIFFLFFCFPRLWV